MKPIQVPPGGGHALNVLGTPMLIRVHGRDTGGTVSVVETHELPDMGTPPHVHHREEETFQVLEGEYEFTVAGQQIRVTAGATLFAPRDVPHCYRCVGPKPGRLLCVITPAGFERFFEEIDALTPEQQQDVPRVMGIAKKFGLEILPPPGASAGS